MDRTLPLVQFASLAEAQKGVTVIVRMAIKPQHTQEYEQIAVRLAADVAAHEPGCVFFAAQRTMGGEDHYVVVGRFRTWGDLETHWASAHLARATSQGARLASAPAEVEFFMDL